MDFECNTSDKTKICENSHVQVLLTKTIKWLSTPETFYNESLY